MMTTWNMDCTWRVVHTTDDGYRTMINTIFFNERHAEDAAATVYNHLRDVEVVKIPLSEDTVIIDRDEEE